MRQTARFVSLFLLVMSAGLWAQRTTDIQNGKDYPLVSRFSGSIMEWRQEKNFDKYYLLTREHNQLKPREIDGRITRIQYSSQPAHSVFEIFKSYENALKAGGFEILLTLDKSNCGVNLSERLYVGEFNGLNALPPGSVKPDFKEDEYAYLAARKAVDGREVYVVVYVTSWDYPLITFDAIEVQAMSKGLVSVQDLDAGLARNGHMAVYDIYFDSGKSVVKPGSEKALGIIAAFMKSHPDRRYMIVGHTDTTGDFNANVTLSRARAEAVTNALVDGYGVNRPQLRAWGCGPAAPVAANSTEAGRARNRRVEIVVE